MSTCSAEVDRFRWPLQSVASWHSSCLGESASHETSRYWLIYRYDQGVFSGIIGNENFRAQFGNPNTGLEGIIVSIYNLGCFTGCIFAFLFCERTGRRLAMWIAMAFIIVSTINLAESVGNSCRVVSNLKRFGRRDSKRDQC
jgi:hypothetical protein